MVVAASLQHCWECTGKQHASHWEIGFLQLSFSFGWVWCFFSFGIQESRQLLNPHRETWLFIRGAAPNQQPQAGITVIMWEEMQRREFHFKAPSFAVCTQVPLVQVELLRGPSQGIAASTLERGLGGGSLERWLAGKCSRWDEASRLRRASPSACSRLGVRL